jgi:hypothetical protein
LIWIDRLQRNVESDSSDAGWNDGRMEDVNEEVIDRCNDANPKIDDVCWVLRKEERMLRVHLGNHMHKIRAENGNSTGDQCSPLVSIDARYSCEVSIS